jgi:hypothetical protein
VAGKTIIIVGCGALVKWQTAIIFSMGVVICLSMAVLAFGIKNGGVGLPHAFMGVVAGGAGHLAFFITRTFGKSVRLRCHNKMSFSAVKLGQKHLHNTV